MADHRDLTAPSGHVVGYVQAGDPGAIGAGKIWVDITDGLNNYKMFVRNAGDTAWESIERPSCWMMEIVTVDAALTEMLLGGLGGTRLVIPDDTTWFFEIHVCARRTDGDNESAGYVRRGVIDRNAGVTALVGAVSLVYTQEDSGAWDITVDADAGNNALRLQATGEVGKNIQWMAKIFITEAMG